MTSMSIRPLRERLTRSAVLVAAVLLSTPPASAGVFSGLISKLDQFNGELITLGGVGAVTGFIWALLAMLGQLGGAAWAITVLIVSLCISNAKTIVGFFAGA